MVLSSKIEDIGTGGFKFAEEKIETTEREIYIRGGWAIESFLGLRMNEQLVDVARGTYLDSVGLK
jgi:hypothetical protein